MCHHFQIFDLTSTNSDGAALEIPPKFPEEESPATEELLLSVQIAVSLSELLTAVVLDRASENMVVSEDRVKT
jgi:hypothetical protein